jgi:hypothetical protein
MRRRTTHGDGRIEWAGDKKKHPQQRPHGRRSALRMNKCDPPRGEKKKKKVLLSQVTRPDETTTWRGRANHGLDGPRKQHVFVADGRAGGPDDERKEGAVDPQTTATPLRTKHPSPGQATSLVQQSALRRGLRRAGCHALAHGSISTTHRVVWRPEHGHWMSSSPPPATAPRRRLCRAPHLVRLRAPAAGGDHERKENQTAHPLFLPPPVGDEPCSAAAAAAAGVGFHPRGCFCQPDSHPARISCLPACLPAVAAPYFRKQRETACMQPAGCARGHGSGSPSPPPQRNVGLLFGPRGWGGVRLRHNVGRPQRAPHFGPKPPLARPGALWNQVQVHHGQFCTPCTTQ